MSSDKYNKIQINIPKLNSIQPKINKIIKFNYAQFILFNLIELKFS